MYTHTLHLVCIVPVLHMYLVQLHVHTLKNTEQLFQESVYSLPNA